MRNSVTVWLTCEVEDQIAIHRAIADCRALIQFLVGPRRKGLGKLEKLKRWLTDKTIGSLDFMRIDLLRRLDATQEWVQMRDGIKLDCVWVPSITRGKNDPTVLFCNPNGGLYEFSCFQIEFIDIYVRNNMNVFMYNYRGYGRSQGRPSPENILSDGVQLAEYLTHVKHVNKLVVHGESLGGMVACHIASHHEVAFLFADRTFASLEEVGNQAFHNIAGICLKYIRWWNDETAGNFIRANGYKVISCDPKDEVISDLASLKTGVALQLLADGFPLGGAEVEEFSRVYCEVMDAILGKKIKRAVEISNLPQDQEEEINTNLLHELYEILFDIDAGGKRFTEVYDFSNKIQSLKSWIAVFLVYGAYNTTQNINPKDSAYSQLLKTLERLREITKRIQGYDLKASINQLIDGLCKIQDVFEEGEQLETVSLKQKDFSSAGNLLPLRCGHSGPLFEEDHVVHINHLRNANLII